MLKMNLLGSWVDGEATSDAVPFFHALVQAAVATNNRNARRFIVDDMLPATIKRLCDGLPCAVQQTIGKLSSLLNSSKSKKASEDLLVLCEEIHKVYIQSQDFTAQDRDNENIGDQFKDWFTRQKEDLRKKASCAVPAHFPVALWNWEFEDEFQRYLPTYIDILYEVDAMDDCQKSPYGRHSAMARLMEDVTTGAEPSHLDVRDAVDIFYNIILFSLEPQFHPLIRVDHMNFLTKIAHQFIFAEEINCYKPLEPKSDDFPVHLQPHSSSFIYRMKITSKYLKAREQVHLHQELDEYLALGKLDDDICRLDLSQDNSVEEFSVKHLKFRQLGKLNSTLIRLSLQDRAQIVDLQRHIDTYSENLRIILANKMLKDCLEKIMNELKEKAFFDVDNDSTDWKTTCFISLIQKFKELVFKGHDCPQYVAVQGIMEYWRISKRSDKAAEVALEKDVEVVCHKWKQNIAELWRDTRYYEESCYDFIRDPLKKILPREEKSQISKKKKKKRKEKPQNHGRPPTMVG